MYTACTFRLAKVLGLGFLELLLRGFIDAALAAWAVVFLGWIRAVIGTRGGSAPQAPRRAAGTVGAK